MIRADRFPAIAATAGRLRAKSFVIDGELVCCGPEGIADFEWLRSCRHDREAFVYAIDLIGADLRRDPIERRKTRRLRLLKPAPGSGSPASRTSSRTA